MQPHQPKLNKASTEQGPPRSVTESAPLNNTAYVQSQEASINLQNQTPHDSQGAKPKKKLQLGGNNFKVDKALQIVDQLSPPQSFAANTNPVQTLDLDQQAPAQFNQDPAYYPNYPPQQVPYGAYPQQQYAYQQYPAQYPPQYYQQPAGYYQQQYIGQQPYVQHPVNQQFPNQVNQPLPTPQQAMQATAVPTQAPVVNPTVIPVPATNQGKEKKRLSLAAKPLSTTVVTEDTTKTVKATPAQPAAQVQTPNEDQLKKQQEQKQKEEQQKQEAERIQKQKEDEEKQLRATQLLAPQKRTTEFFLEFLSKQDNQVEIQNPLILSLKDRAFKSVRSVSKPSTGKPYANNQGNNNNKQRPNQRPSYIKPQPEPTLPTDFERGSKVQTIIQENTATGTTVQISRHVEDISVKQKKEEIKKNLNWLSQVKVATNEQEAKLRDIKFRLNQLAPDNKNNIIDMIISRLVEDKELVIHVAKIILDKAGLESRYRELYTELCQKIVACKDLEFEKEGKKRQLFKDAILSSVQEVFESDESYKMNETVLQKMKQSEREEYYIRRKNRILGNVRFIGELFIKGVLPEMAIYNAQGSLLHKFLQLSKEFEQQKNSLLNNPEDHLEGLIELYDKAGQRLEEAQQKKKKNKPNFENEKQQLKDIAQKFAKNVDVREELLIEKYSVEGLFFLLNALKAKPSMSTRMRILIDNLTERRRGGWFEHVSQKNESAKSVSELVEQEETYRDDRRGSKRDNNRDQRERQNYTKTPMYVAKQPSQPQQQQTQSQVVPKHTQQEFKQVEPVVEKKVELPLAQEVAEYFNYTLEELITYVESKVKEIRKDQELLKTFWVSFFSKLLQSKKSNIEKAKIVFSVVVDIDEEQLDTSSFLEGFQEQFNKEDFLYDTFETNIGKQIFLELWKPFFLHDRDGEIYLQDYFKISVEGEEDLVQQYKEYFLDVARLLVEEKVSRESIIKFYQSNLGFSADDLDGF